MIATLEYPPFIYSEGNEVKGPIAEKVRNVFTSLGITVRIEMLPITRGLAMVASGDVDAFFSLKRTPERDLALLFTKVPLIQQPFVFFTRRDSAIQWNGRPDDIKGYRIGVVSKTSYGKIFDAYVKDGILAHIEETQSFEVNIKKLIAGRVDLVINSYDVGQYLIQKLHAEDDIVSLSPPVETVTSYLAFTRARDYSRLADKFDEALSRGDQ